MSLLTYKTGFSTEEKSEALEHVLTSRTFQKSDLLKQFLNYVCHKEMAGEGGEITEFCIATEALGRPQDFSPDEDSSVRSRAHALRKKLDDYYREEGQHTRLRIRLPKGSYVPEFAASVPEDRPPTVETAWRATEPRYPHGLIALTFFAGVATALLAIFVVPYLSRKTHADHPVPEVIRTAWGPLLNPDTDDLVVVAVPHQFLARDFPSEVTPKYSPWYPKIEQSRELLQWYFDRSSTPPDRFILLHPNIGSPLWGDAAGAIGIEKMLSEQNIKHEVLPERVLQPYALHARNAMLFGNPDYSPSARVLLQDAPFSIAYDYESGWEAVINRKPRPGEPDAFRVSRSDDCMGLISVFGDETNAGKLTQVVVFSGLKSGGTQAAQEFFSSPKAMTELASHFKDEGLAGKWPSSYQVVVQTKMTETLPIQFSYRTHRIIRR